MERALSNKDIEDMEIPLELETDWVDKRPMGLPNRRKNRKDRRKAINTCMDPAMDRRVYNRRNKDRK